MVTVPGWRVDTSTFINAVVVNRVFLLSRVRSPMAFAQYVYAVELTGPTSKPETRAAAEREHAARIGVDRLTIDDLFRMSQMPRRRRVDLGELATAVLAERSGCGVLCDDHKAVMHLKRDFPGVPAWESIEHVLLHAALEGLLGEHELDALQERLAACKYHCRFDLKTAYSQTWLQRQQAALASAEKPSSDPPPSSRR